MYILPTLIGTIYYNLKSLSSIKIYNKIGHWKSSSKADLEKFNIF